MQGRRGTLYHISSPAALKHQESVADIKARKRFSSLHFVVSPAGILKVLVIVVLIVAPAIFLSADQCPLAPTWYTWLFPVVTIAVVVSTCVTYVLLTLGMGESNPDLWVKVDVTLTTMQTIITLAVSILVVTECNSSDVQFAAAGSLGMLGALLQAVAAGAIYVMWKYRDKEPAVATSPAPMAERQHPRFSVYV